MPTPAVIKKTTTTLQTDFGKADITHGRLDAKLFRKNSGPIHFQPLQEIDEVLAGWTSFREAEADELRLTECARVVAALGD